MAIIKRTAIAAAVRLALAEASSTSAAIAAVARDTLLPEEAVEECCPRCPKCSAVLTEEEEVGDGICAACDRLDALAWLDDDDPLIQPGEAGTRSKP